MKSSVLALICALLASLPALPALAVDLPPEGACPPLRLRPGTDGDTVDEDVVPSLFQPGQKLDLGSLSRVTDYLPREVWDRRLTFFYEGMQMELGPCFRRYPVPEFFTKQTLANAGRTKLDEQGNLAGYSGKGLPFPIDTIDDSAPDAGRKWAWNHRYRYQGAGYRGRFRLLDVSRAGRQIERFEGRFFMLPLHGVPGVTAENERNRFVAGGEFTAPSISRGLSWRQFRSVAADGDFKNSDDVFVYLPAARKVRRAPPQSLEGVYVPSYTRANTIDASSVTLPTGETVGDVTMTASEPVRRGFVGLVIRPNAYEFELERTQDVLAPINSIAVGYPSIDTRSYGPSGLSVADDRWELRRAVVLKGKRKEPEGNVHWLTLYVDAETLAPLYLITRRANRTVYEVGIFVGRYSGEEALSARWQGSGAIVPVAQTFKVSAAGGWLRESFELASDPPSADESRRFQTSKRLQLEGR